MTAVQIPTRRLVLATAVATVLALAPVVAVFAGPSIDPAPHAIADDGCSGSDTTDSYSLQCVPTNVPDFSDQLTEADVAEPGFNAGSGPGGGGGGGGGGHR
jgi:hypothetical protein